MPQESSLLVGDELFVLGSIMFSIAAFVSAVRTSGESATDDNSVLRRRIAVAVASLYELGGVAFVVGTLGFIPAGPLGISACPEGAETLGRAGAYLFLGGSFLYTFGSLLALWCVATLTYGDQRLEPRGVNDDTPGEQTADTPGEQTGGQTLQGNQRENDT